jgi:hypothetical protein
MLKVKRAIVMCCALGLVAVFSGCFFDVYVEPTTVRAQNDLYDLVLDVNGVESDVSGINLNAVVIGDVVYSRINAGEITNGKEIGEVGYVDVFIGSADVWYIERGMFVDFYYKDTFEDIDPMETYIRENTLNTVVFDEETAGVIFSVLAKKRRAAL